MTACLESALSNERPFPGLRPFSVADGPFFFGRTEQIYTLYRMVERSRFVAVVGSSGSGKSSLVRAGLRPLLAEESAEEAGHTWVCLEMRPGSTPLARLADALATLSRDDDPPVAAARRDRIGFQLRRSSFGIEAAVGEIEGLRDERILLIVDQFEELFRYGAPIGAGDRAEAMQRREDAALFVQLLLEVDRKRSGSVHVLLTMRSDFIGDCVRFPGLPEAVSASQFLVPGMTRDQLEEVVCEPVSKAGASIEPALVERILNDCSEEPDNLPVLQHCLLRLWERAGAAVASPGSPRRLDVGHYRAIGGMDEALSRHADEVMQRLDVAEIEVEQVMRALAERDREGRAIRRPLELQRLQAETGVDETRLIRILDRFRAVDCSFLVPSLEASPRLAPTTTIDVGHEALLRRWRKVSGESRADPLGEDVDAPSNGWLRAEERDGQRYRTLLTLLERKHDTGTALPIDRIEEDTRWWKGRPRTTAWAERYGGSFDRVEAALQEGTAALTASRQRASQAARVAKLQERRRRRTRRLLLGGLLGVLVVIAGTTYFFYQQREAIKNNFALAVRSSHAFLDAILKSFLRGDITIRGAKALAETAEAVTADVRNSRIDPETTSLWIDLQIVKFDLAMNLGETREGLELARTAKTAAEQLVKDNPGNLHFLQLLFGTTARLADVLSARRPDDKNNLLLAAEEYKNALAVAERMIRLQPGNIILRKNIVEMYEKLSDIQFMSGANTQAIQQLQSALAIVRSAIATSDSDDWQRLFANVHFRMSGAYRDCRDWTKAYSNLMTARATQEALLAKDPSNYIVQSNYVATRTRLGDIWKKQYLLSRAIAEYQAGVERLEGLVLRDPTNPLWRALLAPDYVNLGEVLQSLGMRRLAADVYRKSFLLRKNLLARDPNNASRQAALALIADRLADTLVERDQLGEREEMYASALGLWDKLVRGEALRTRTPKYAYERFADHIKLADIKASSGDWAAAWKRYGVAIGISRQAAAAGVDTSGWQDHLARDRQQPYRHFWGRGGLRRLNNPANWPQGC